ncbi:hypothetical protein RJ640_001860 [Escallonia rubra]|uniref:Trichome birefringence-like N-terminal domain-containing protein n=1 Tax=Escallonia rubra TaxID=112253 RepID=A0AA88RW79_9ASTE|nr:hypothetical protein RJ640_001860 [Escallonia rubra]
MKEALNLLTFCSALLSILSTEAVSKGRFKPSSIALLTIPGNTISNPMGEEKCDLFTGDWIRNPAGPVYTNQSCHLIEHHQNCVTNGRPDTQYLYWKWKPRDCELPQFNAKRFLELMRNKAWALIGDSISRNHVQSLLCILSKARFSKASPATATAFLAEECGREARESCGHVPGSVQVAGEEPVGFVRPEGRADAVQCEEKR